MTSTATPTDALERVAATPAAISADLRATVAGAIAASKAPATRRAYRTAWQRFDNFAAQAGAQAIPAAPELVAAYLAARAQDGAGLATLRMATAAIAAAHEAAGQTSPTADRIVRAVLAGFARQAAQAGAQARQARPLDSAAVATIRGALNGQSDTPRGARTMALIATVADAGLRRSEAAALRWQDIDVQPDGSGRITIRRSKTDQAGAGAVVAVTAAAAADLERHGRINGRADDAAVFGLSDRQIARTIAAAARKAGLGSGFSGHSGRVGMAQRMTAAGAPAAAVMRQGRWSSTRMIARYTRAQAAGEALRYL